MATRLENSFFDIRGKRVNETICHTVHHMPDQRSDHHLVVDYGWLRWVTIIAVVIVCCHEP